MRLCCSQTTADMVSRVEAQMHKNAGNAYSLFVVMMKSFTIFRQNWNVRLQIIWINIYFRSTCCHFLAGVESIKIVPKLLGWRKKQNINVDVDKCINFRQ